MKTIRRSHTGRQLDIPQVTPQDIVEEGEFSYHGILRAIHRGELRAYKLCGQWRMYAADVEAWVESCVAPEPDRRAEPPAVKANQPAPARGTLAALRQLETQRRPAA